MVFGGDDRVGGGHHLSNNLCSVCTEWLDYLANLSCDLSGCDGNVDRLPYVQRLRGHVNVDLISLSLPLRARMALAIFTLLMSCLIVVVMLW